MITKEEIESLFKFLEKADWFNSTIIPLDNKLKDWLMQEYPNKLYDA